MNTLLPANGLSPLGFTESTLSAGSFVTGSGQRGTLDNLIRLKRKIRVNIAYVLIGAMLFATVLAWIEVLRSSFDDAFPLKARREDPNYVRFEATYLRLYFAVFLTAISIFIIWMLIQFIQHQNQK